MLSCQLRITGTVQGVGFRESLRRMAEREGVGGWVRNRLDGSVEAVLQGPEAAVQRVVCWARRGPPAARVAALTVTPAREVAADTYAGFELRPTV